MLTTMFRSLIFVPSNNKRFIHKAKLLNADIICFDLEDSVPETEKEIARRIMTETISERTEYKANLYIRINSLKSNYAFLDLKAIVLKGIDGIVVPKVNDESEIKEILTFISSLEEKRGIGEKSIKLIPSIETAKGVVNAYSIAKTHERINALIFGVFDFLYDMHLDYLEDDEIGYTYARAKIPIDARAAGISAIDAVWQKVDDINGLIKDATIAKRLGYAGKSVIHPNQIQPIHKIFRPSRNEIEWANKVINALDRAREKGINKGAVKIEGKMIDAVHYRQAKLILDTINQYENI